MKLFDKLFELVYPNGYISTVKQDIERVENNTKIHNGILLQKYLSISIYWCDIKQEYVTTYKIPDNLLTK